MRYDALRREAAKGLVGECPACKGALVPKCGSLVAHHWAHARGRDCDPWYDPSAHEWHLEWQRRYADHCSEVVIGPHRADLVLNGWVVELQHSHLSVGEIAEREAFYGKSQKPLGMQWIWDARAFASRLEVRSYDPSSGRVTFRWKHPRKSMFACTALSTWDLGGGWLLASVYTDEGKHCAGMGVGYLRRGFHLSGAGLHGEWPRSRYAAVTARSKLTLGEWPGRFSELT